MAKEKTAWDNALAQLDAAASIMKLKPHVHEILRNHQREFTASFPVKMDDGSIRIFKGFRFQHNLAIGPGRGGTRLHEDETPDDVRALSLWMSVKNACNNVMSGGAKGGVVVDAAKLSRGELERLCRAYVRAMAPVFDPQLDQPGSDIGTSMQTQAWMLDEWQGMRTNVDFASVSSKPPALGGTAGRQLSTAYGILFATREVTKKLGLTMHSLKAVVHGYGTLGSGVVKLYARDGIRICGVCDINGTVYNPDGIDVPALEAHFAAKKTLDGFPGANKYSTTEILEVPCDILVPCSVQNVVHEGNVGRIQARIVMEGANGPMTVGAEEVLLQKGVFISPDVYTNSGATQLGYFERIQNLCNDRWTEEFIIGKLEASFIETFKELYETSQSMGITMRMACWVKALKRIIEAMEWRGWI